MSKKRPKAILFDLGEVLLRLDFTQLFTRLRLQKSTVGEAMDALGRWELYDAFERGLLGEDEFRQRIEESLAQSFGADEFRRLWNSVIIGAVPGVEEMMQGLASQAKIFALTNSNEIHIRHVRQNFPWIEKWGTLYSSHELGARKPEAVIYEKALATMGVAAGEVLFIDDRRENVEGARRVGLDAEHCQESPKDLRDILTRYGFALS